MKAEIITIGDEILIGQIIDSNSAWIAQELNKIGITVHQISSISDKEEHIIDALNQAKERADLILITGGLGPTKDDLTKHTLVKYFNTKLVFNEQVHEQIKILLAQRNVEMNKLNSLQAELPENCEIINNSNGTAQGMWFEQNNTFFISMPGVPFEMKKIVTDELIPKLKREFKTKSVYHKTVMTQGIPESMLSIKISDWENNLPNGIKLAYLPQPGMVRLRLSCSCENINKFAEIIETEINKLYDIIPNAIFGFNDISLEETVGKLLTKKNKTIATAESCTGGTIAQMLTAISGSSKYVRGSVVAYSNDIKENILGVKTESLIKYGAVSNQVVEEMATGILKLMKSDYSIAVSGIAGPNGGTKEKPVGTIHIAIASKNGVKSHKFLYGEHRGRNIRRSALTALNLLRLEIMNNL